MVPDTAYSRTLPWILLARETAFRRLEESGMRGLLGVPVDLRFKDARKENYVEIEMRPRATIARHILGANTEASCLTCGYSKISLPDPLLLERTSIPMDMELFRGNELTTHIFATERFKVAVERLGLTGLPFEEIQLTPT